MDLFRKDSAIINTRVLFNNYKKRARRNWDESKDGFNIFEIDTSNINVKKNNRVILDCDYNSNSI